MCSGLKVFLSRERRKIDNIQVLTLSKQCYWTLASWSKTYKLAQNTSCPKKFNMCSLQLLLSQKLFNTCSLPFLLQWRSKLQDMNYVTILLLVTHRCILTYDQLQQELDVTNAPTINVPISPNVTFVTDKITLNTLDMDVAVKSVFFTSSVLPTFEGQKLKL